MTTIAAGHSSTTPEASTCPIQGSAADLLHLALGKLPPAISDLDACPALFVHDEVVLEVAEADAEEAGRRLSRVMTEALSNSFPAAGQCQIWWL